MIQLKFGTDGWRAIIAKEYTVDNVKRVSSGAAKWMNGKGFSKVIIGYDCRFGGRMFAEAAASVFGGAGIQVILSDGFVSTPMVSLAVVKESADLGIVITASHNPPSYNGYKLKAKYGGPTIPKEVAEVEALIPNHLDIPSIDLAELQVHQLLSYMDLEGMYIKHLYDGFDIELLQQFSHKMAYDGMFGAGQNVMKKLFPKATFLHCEYNPSFLGTAPEPIDRNLRELSSLVKTRTDLLFGMANDGDADRLGMYDEDGEFVDSHRLLCLLLKYLYEYKGIQNGKVVYSFSVSERLKKLADHYGLESAVTPIGFKHIAEIMSEEDVLIGGEESGGFAVKGHIPERDGIWTGLLIMEYMAKTGKTLRQLLDDLYEMIGPFDFYRNDLHIDDAKKWAIVEACKTGKFSSFGPFKVREVQDVDGHKFIFDDTAWVMIRPSGTEPVLRVYAQGRDMAEVKDILRQTQATVLEVKA